MGKSFAKAVDQSIIDFGGKKGKKQEEAIEVTLDEVLEYDRLRSQAKMIEDRMKSLKDRFFKSIDAQVGKGAGGLEVGGFVVVREARESVKFDDEKTVLVLEEKGLTECIDIIKKPNEEKIESVMTLGMLAPADLEGCLIKKTTYALQVKEKKVSEE